MAKKSEINKKGRLAKSTLSVVLAASMVLTSSSFVWAAPVEDIAIVEEGDTVVEAVEAPVEEAVGASVSEAEIIESNDVSENVRIAATDVNISVADGTYTGKEVRPTVTVTAKVNGSDVTIPLKDYDVKYSNNINAGVNTAKVRVEFKGDYLGTDPKEETFSIKPLELNASNTTVTYKTHYGFVYNGSEQSPEVASVVVATADGNITLAPSDYKVSAVSGDLISAGDKSIKLDLTTNSNYKLGVGFILGENSYTIDKATFNKDTVSVTSKNVAFTGSAVSANVSVKNAAGKAVTEYSIEYFDKDGNSTGTTAQTNMGTYKIVLKATGSGNYVAGGTIETTYTIAGETLEMAAESAVLTTSAGNVDKDEDGYYLTYNGADQAISGATGIGNLTAGTDYEVDLTAAKGKDVGSFNVVLKGINKYAGQSVAIPVAIRPMPITDVDKDTASTGKFVYSASLGKTHSGTDAANAVFEISRIALPKNVKLEEGKDYTYTTDKTKGKVVITGMGNYTTDISASQKTLELAYDTTTKINMADASITGTVSGTYSYTGRQITPPSSSITVVENGATPYTLVYNKDYTISYGNNIEAGEGTVIITGKDAYVGEKELTFKISGTAIEDVFKIQEIKDVSLADAKNNKGKVAPKIVYLATGATAPSAAYGDINYYRDGKKLNDGDDAFTTVGTIDIEVEAAGQYEGLLKASYKIVGDDIATVAKVADIEDQAFTGKALEPEVKVTLANGTLLKKDTDYTVKYDKNTEVGTAYATISGMGSYSGEIVKSFKIVGTDISKAIVTVDGTYSYTGKAIIPTVTVKLGDKIIDAASYDVTATDNTNAGTAKVTVTGKGGCTGTTEAVEFIIAKADQKLAVSKATADALKIRNTNANTYTLKVTGAGTALSYTSSNTKVASVSSTGKLSFKHVCGKATITVTAAADDNHKAATLDVAVVVKPATPKITVTARSKGFNARATTVKDITGYQVGYSTDKNFTASKTTKKLVKTTKALNKNFSGLSAKKGYYVRVRAYKKVGSTVYWGNWTSAKKITTK